VFAWLWLVAAGLGLITQPLLGRLIDHIGERRVLMGDAALLILVCLGYGYADRLGLGPLTIHLLYACFIMDQLLFATGMARATYLKKIALAPEHVASSLALGVSLDHTVSMTIPRVGGQLWDAHGKHGYRYVFTAAAIIAAVNLIFASLLKLPGRALEVPTTVPPAPLATDEPPGLE
jgi:MFS family permease